MTLGSVCISKYIYHWSHCSGMVLKKGNCGDWIGNFTLSNREIGGNFARQGQLLLHSGVLTVVLCKCGNGFTYRSRFFLAREP